MVNHDTVIESSYIQLFGNILVDGTQTQWFVGIQIGDDDQ
jgi:hypothetical protein